MNVTTAIEKRRSIRRYTKKPLDYETLVLLTEAGFRAPSTGNVKDYRFIVMTNPDNVKKIGKYCHEQYWVQEAPAIIAVCSNLTNTKEYYPEKANEYAKSNADAAAQNILLVSTELGLGSCWLGNYDKKRIKEVLGISDGHELQSLITIGYPDETPKKRPEANLHQYVFFEKYGNQIKDIDSEINQYSQKIENAAGEAKSAFQKTLDVIKNYFQK